MNNRVFKVFIDFDGTITNIDIGDTLFRYFGKKEIVDPTIDKLLSGEISARESWLTLCEAVEKIDEESLTSFVNEFHIDGYFKEFVDFCFWNNIEVYILSDGFDIYINKIFEAHGLSHLKCFSNKMTITDEGKLLPEFPYYDASFPTSANCKRNHILSLSSDTDYTIFIGDGNSDKYAAVFCDFIFAKLDLLKFCEKERIPYSPFKTFYDVKTKVEILLNKKNLNKRHQALVKRKEAYMVE